MADGPLVAVIGGSGLCRQDMFTVTDTVRPVTPYGTTSDDIEICSYVDSTGRSRKLAFLPRHGAQHTLAPHGVPYRANIAALQSLGVQQIVATCIAGSLRRRIRPGDLVIPDQFANFTWGRDPDGPPELIHVPMANPYCERLRARCATHGASAGLRTHRRGTVAVIQGPRFSTRAESRWFSRQGWDLVNMTQYPECYLAREAGICYATLAMITDYDVGVSRRRISCSRGQCGEIGMYERGGSPVVLVNTPELVRSLLVDRTSDLAKGSVQQTAFRALLGQSLSMSEGDRHDRLRRMLAPLFTRRRIARFAQRIAVTAEPVTSTWATETEIDLFAELHRLTVHTVGRCLIDEPSLWDEDRPFWQARENLWSWINSLAGQRRSLAQPVTDTTDADVDGLIGAVQAITDRIIEARRNNANWPDDILSDVLRANARAGHLLNDTEVRDQILALLFAAHETSAAAVFWSLYLLGRHPTVRNRVEHEVEKIPAGSAIDLAALPYTLQVAKEAMRLYPPAGRQFRVASHDTNLDGYPLREGTAVTVCQYVLHRNPASFPEPNRFDPDRFVSGAASRHPLSYIPFGAGEHICLGRHYAAQEIHLLLFVLLRRFRFEFDERVAAQLAVTVRPPRGLLVRISPVE